MQSRYLTHLNAKIESAKGQFEADCLVAERSCYLARLGRFAEARLALKNLHEQYDRNPNVLMSSWLGLAEGLMAYFENLGPISRDRILRSHALSAAARQISMQALSAAWLAQIEFTRLNIDSVVKYCKEALELASPIHHSARSRVSLVVAHALHVGGRYDLARPWYRTAQIHAVTQGDDATISALMHNMTCMRLENYRQLKLSGQGLEDGIDLVLTGAESTESFDLMIGASSLGAMKPLLHARLLSLKDRPTEALGIYEGNLESLMSQGYSRLRSEILSDIALCNVLVGNQGAAIDMLINAENSIVSDTQIDDLAATRSRLSVAYSLLGMTEVSARHALLADSAWEEYRTLQAAIVHKIGALASN